MRSGIATVLTGTLVLMAGCASWVPATKSSATVASKAVTAPDELIARDFARAIVQIPVLSPATTTVRFDEDSGTGDRFLDVLQRSLRQAGYGIQITSEAGRPNRISHGEKREAEPGGSTFTTHEMAVGTVRFRRQYRIDAAGYVRPASALFVKGADATSLVMNDSLFDRGNGAMNSSGPSSLGNRGTGNAPSMNSVEHSSNSTGPSPSTDVLTAVPPRPVLPRIPMTASVSSPLISQAQANARASTAVGGFGASSSGGGSREILPYTRNVFEIGQSNFDDLLGDYRNIDERILVFGNDSMRLGKQNKAIIESMVENFDAQNDVMSLVGCSLGATRITNGNQTLALGRANRVKEALVLAGVPQSRILDEGCWAGEADRKMPSRGVVITHRRERT